MHGIVCSLSKIEKQEGKEFGYLPVGREIAAGHQFALMLIGTDENSGISPSTKVGWVRTASRRPYKAFLRSSQPGQQT